MPSAPVPALDWERLSRRYHCQHWLERDAVGIAVGLLDPAPSERVLDLATGTGEVLRALARRPAPPRRVIGVDSSSRMLARVAALPAGWDLLLGDARALRSTVPASTWLPPVTCCICSKATTSCGSCASWCACWLREAVW